MPSTRGEWSGAPWPITLCLVFSFLSAVGCGGGCSSQTSVPVGAPAAEARHTGSLFYSSKEGFYSLNLQTGDKRQHVSLCCESSKEADEAVLSDNDRTIVTADFEVQGTQYATIVELISLNDGSRKRLEIPAEITRDAKPKMSPDGSAIAMALKFASSGNKFGLSLIDREGNLLWQFSEDSQLDENGHFYNHIQSWEWSKSGSLYIGEGDTIFVADLKTSLDKTVLKRFPGFELYETLSLSPEGSQLIFSMSPYPLTLRKGQVQLYSLNLNTLEHRQLTTSEYDVDGAAWSPDGKYIVVRKGIDPMDFTVEPCFGALLVIPATSAAAVDVDTADADSISSVSVVEGGQRVQECGAVGEIDWRA